MMRLDVAWRCLKMSSIHCLKVSPKTNSKSLSPNVPSIQIQMQIQMASIKCFSNQNVKFSLCICWMIDAKNCEKERWWKSIRLLYLIFLSKILIKNHIAYSIFFHQILRTFFSSSVFASIEGFKDSILPHPLPPKELKILNARVAWECRGAFLALQIAQLV